MKRRHGINTSHTKHIRQPQQSQQQQTQTSVQEDPLSLSHTASTTVQVSKK